MEHFARNISQGALRKELFTFCEDVTYREIMDFKYFM